MRLPGLRRKAQTVSFKLKGAIGFKQNADDPFDGTRGEPGQPQGTDLTIASAVKGRRTAIADDRRETLATIGLIYIGADDAAVRGRNFANATHHRS